MKRKVFLFIFILFIFAGILFVYGNPVKSKTMYVNAESCRVRTGPGETYDVEGLLAYGQKVKTIGAMIHNTEEENGWYQIDANALPAEFEFPEADYYIRADILSEKLEE
ncbi:MAG: hypothetical protein Q4C58_15190 [Eubacteriales bacterium]|nr:hypothetical protein [Eubacteriales bacterium]